MRRAAAVSLIFLLLQTVTGTSAKADSTNPPKIISVEQLTSGPYKPGDVITFRVNFSGGNPGIQSIQFQGSCLRVDRFYRLTWNEKTTEIPALVSQNIFTSTVTGLCESGKKPYSVYISDKTNLSSSWNSGENDSYEVVGGYQLPNGTIRPEKQADAIDLSYIPLVEFNPQKNQQFELPKLTKQGIPIYWDSVNSGGCALSKRFPGDTGGTLKIVGRGLCILYRDSNEADNHLFSSPVVNTKWKMANSTARYLRADIWEKGKPHYILCAKGNKTQKFYSADSTCPRGFKQR